ncbi:unnamed protein product [Somion occarium]|uniref:Secreted protein n=1 Tax=Somion occarium TaxID=3059160 RepID=A0ABP1CSD8_9APHY
MLITLLVARVADTMIISYRILPFPVNSSMDLPCASSTSVRLGPATVLDEHPLSSELQTLPVIVILLTPIWLDGRSFLD